MTQILRELSRRQPSRCESPLYHPSPAVVQCHPDKVPPEEREEAEKRFKDLNEAHEILTDSRKRHRYDSGADMMEDDGGGFRGGGFGGMDMDDLMGVRPR